MVRVLVLLVTLSASIGAITVDDDSLKSYYIKYENRYKEEPKNDSVAYIHGLTTFDGKKSVEIIKSIPDESELSLDKKKYIADYYFSLGSYLTAAKLYREYLEDQTDIEVIISLLTTDIVAQKFKEFDTDNAKYGDILKEEYKVYFNALYFHKKGDNKQAYRFLTDVEISELYATNYTYKIKAYTLKLEVLSALGKKTEGARLAKYLVDHYENVPEVSRWLDLYPSLGNMVKDQSTKLSKSSSSSKKSSRVYYGYQFGSFSDKKNAQTLKTVLEAKYKKKGISIYIRPQNRSGKTVYAVTTHAFKTEKNARKYYKDNYKNKVSDKMFFVKIYK